MKIGILGASTMGIGLIQICAQHGFEGLSCEKTGVGKCGKG